MKLLHFEQKPILDQLLLEEALLRANQDNWALINEGSSKAIVMGISSKAEEWVSPFAFQDQIPVIRRFSGGGTVIVDENTLFVTFIFNASTLPFPPYPEPILRFTEGIYQPVFNHKAFQIQGTDYAMNDRKCGGNAQYIRKGRWLHHTTFLWDYDPCNMEYLLHPKKMPSYRNNRPHADFVCRLKDYFPSKKTFIHRLKSHLSATFGAVESQIPFFQGEYRRTTHLYDKTELSSHQET
ncbi:MAG: lipoate--protein ligase family protein [Simkaniaceae bacterium]|nr:lipoate--protein ligase family protein [Simkaniaceae bacterium]